MLKPVRARRPLWPSFIFELLAPKGVELLERAYLQLKETRQFPRASRLSADDFATAVIAGWIAEGRFDLLKRAA